MFAWSELPIKIRENPNHQSLVKLYLQTPPVGFAVDLLDWAKDHFEMTDENVHDLVEQEYVCMPSKGCYDPNDIGGHCCPFESKKAK
jgi:hypothetical protein